MSNKENKWYMKYLSTAIPVLIVQGIWHLIKRVYQAIVHRGEDQECCKATDEHPYYSPNIRKDNKQSQSLLIAIPLLLINGIWYLIKLMALSLWHFGDYQECRKQMYKDPRKVSYSARKGMELTEIGCTLLCIISMLLVCLCIHMCKIS